MLGRTKVARGITTKMEWRKPYYLEDNANEFDMSVYLPLTRLKSWYARHELNFGRKWLDTMQKTQSVNAQNGLHYNGDGPFERELRRKGIQVEKYPLPSTTATRRNHEMILLRRQKLEELSRVKMDEARKKVARDAPSGWYDETKGPLNPHYLAMVQPLYKQNVTALPAEPVQYRQLAQPEVQVEAL